MLTLQSLMLMNRFRHTIASLLFALMFALSAVANGKFVLVIDAGHGGKDVGAVGKVAKEKTINLNVALAFGKMVENGCPDVKVIYTRKTDKFVTLQERAAIANRNHADLFISIHTNAVARGKNVVGTETYTLGIARADENLEVAKRENSVITYEDDYKERYEGFDPNSPESYIIFEFMQDRFMEQSVELARHIQTQYTSHAGRTNKGVKQAGFLVLRETSMPSVLTELGFISSPKEEKFLNSKDGQQKLARSLYNGFVKYYKQQAKGGAVNVKPAAPIAEDKPAIQPVEEAPVAKEEKVVPAAKPSSAKPVFKVQILVSDRKLSDKDARIKGLKNVSFYRDGKQYKYTCGSSSSFQEMQKLRRDLSKRFKGCFVVAFEGDKRIDLDEARRRAM